MKSIQPGRILGTVNVPTSKSMMQRYVALATLSSSETIIKNPSLCDDGLASLEVAKGFGLSVSPVSDNTITLTPNPNVNKAAELNCRESGTAYRTFAARCALLTREVSLTGEGSLKKRTMQMVVDALQQLGVSVRSNNGCIPLTICGPITNSNILLDGSMTSQFLSGLLLTLPFHSTASKITVKNLTSKPYIAMTLQAATQFGLSIIGDSSFEHFAINGNQSITNKTEVTVEGDWSSASFLAVAAVTSGKVTLNGIAKESKQADKAIMDVLTKCGAHINWLSSTSVEISAPVTALNAFDFDATDCPDLFPPLVALASATNGNCTVRGTHRLTYKESNRADALRIEFAKLGITVLHHEDALTVVPGIPTAGEPIDPHGDHRIAMAASIAALRCTNSNKGQHPVQIQNPSVINKSFPTFFDILESLYE